MTKYGIISLGDDHFCSENCVLSILKRKEKAHLDGVTELNLSSQIGLIYPLSLLLSVRMPGGARPGDCQDPGQDQTARVMPYDDIMIVRRRKIELGPVQEYNWFNNTVYVNYDKRIKIKNAI